MPPPFGSSGSYTNGTGELLTPGMSGMTTSHNTGYGIPIAANNEGSVEIQYHPPSSINVDMPSRLDVSYSDTSNKFTPSDGMFYSDGRIGTLTIPKLNLAVKVYDEESLENMRLGAAHFQSTSCWDGNVVLCSHNRGAADYFGKIHTLSNGDIITYTTKLGTRKYEVFSVSRISETDLSILQPSNENTISLVTCVMNVPELRWHVKAREVK